MQCEQRLISASGGARKVLYHLAKGTHFFGLGQVWAVRWELTGAGGKSVRGRGPPQQNGFLSFAGRPLYERRFGPNPQPDRAGSGATSARQVQVRQNGRLRHHAIIDVLELWRLQIPKALRPELPHAQPR